MLKGYMAGCNLGHWISQYGTKGKDHYDNYITEPDLKRIAEWGCDHVRLPVDYMIFEKDDNPGEYLEEGLKYVDNAISWAHKYGLNVVLDLHHAPGYFLNHGEKNNLFTNRDSQIRFINIWKFFAERYAAIGDNLRFELLNELSCKKSEQWNNLWQETAEAIFAITPARKVIVGSDHFNMVQGLKNLTISSNPNVLYTFHLYEPMLFSHQRAYWWEPYCSYLRSVCYPCKFEEHREFYGDRIPDGMTENGVFDKEYIRRVMQPAIDFMKKSNRPLYIGEYGVYETADQESMVRWYNDMADLCLEYGMGRSAWSYRGFATITTADNQPGDERIIRAISRR